MGSSRRENPSSRLSHAETRLAKNIRMRPLDNGNFKMTLTPVEFNRLTSAELKEHRERAGLKTLPAIDDE
jgi:hypothetical protein